MTHNEVCNETMRNEFKLDDEAYIKKLGWNGCLLHFEIYAVLYVYEDDAIFEDKRWG